MEVAIRMKKLGTKKKPFFRIVAISKPLARNGKVLEEIGNYEPKKKKDNYKLDKERLEFWLKQGAKPSDTVRDFIKKLGI